jgi:hypothetical protein
MIVGRIGRSRGGNVISLGGSAVVGLGLGKVGGAGTGEGCGKSGGSNGMAGAIGVDGFGIAPGVAPLSMYQLGFTWP